MAHILNLQKDIIKLDLQSPLWLVTVAKAPPRAKFDQQAELFPFTRAKDKIVNIYMDSRYTLEVVLDF